MPYLGPSRVRLPSVWELIASGRWAAEDATRDTDDDVTEDQITNIL